MMSLPGGSPGPDAEGSLMALVFMAALGIVAAGLLLWMLLYAARTPAFGDASSAADLVVNAPQVVDQQVEPHAGYIHRRCACGQESAVR